MNQPEGRAAYSDGMTDDIRLRAIEDTRDDPAREAHTALEATMFEVKRVIVGLDGKRIRNPSELSLNVLTKKPGDEVKVELKRDGKAKTVTVKLGRRPNQVAQ